ncbi:hypothetical protein LTR86_003820 [Recurvomyces mirabilis]|nr:hypothetical protein LTR86_003820 [Recurvomyces mirabilis]
MGPEKSLPISDNWNTTEEYIESLLDLVGNNDLLRTLCGGVHILDFFTSDPDLYSRILPKDWRDFFAQHEVGDILDLLLREDVKDLWNAVGETWKDGVAPPESLVTYIETVRKHFLLRHVKSSQCARNRAMKPTQKMARHVAVGMTIKKVHEVGLFARYISDLTDELSQSSKSGESSGVSHLVDFGSGQNYLGRALASGPYNKSIVAIESRSQNAERAKEFDVMAKLATKTAVMRNKKLYRAGVEEIGLPTPPPETVPSEGAKGIAATSTADLSLDPAIEASPDAKGSIQYIEHRIQDGNLVDVIQQIPQSDPRLMIISLHSCGNLLHHGLRSLILNPAVKAVAMVGCCHNLLTERLGPATYKLPSLRPTTHAHPRLHDMGDAEDEHGFPMSERLCQYNSGHGIRLNITARMMAVQAPQNWGEKDSEAFFTRHFYRALLQRVFLDRGIVGPPSRENEGGSALGHSSGTPIIIGSLRKACYTSFVSYVRGAVAKIILNSSSVEQAALFHEKMETMTDEEIEGYEMDFRQRKKDLSVMWSLMAFSAGVVEAAIVVDRFLWLREQEGVVAEAWVEAVFEYGISPRNLVVVGVKK